MLTDLVFSLQNEPWQTLLRFAVVSAIAGALATVPLSLLRQAQKRPDNTRGIKLAGAAWGLLIGMGVMPFLGHGPGPASRALLFDGPDGLRATLFHQRSKRVGSTHVIRGRSLRDGAALFQTRGSEGDFRIVQHSPSVIWLEEDDGLIGVNLYSGERTPPVDGLVAPLTGGKQYQRVKGYGPVMVLELHDRTNVFVTTAGVVSRQVPPAPSVVVTPVGAEAQWTPVETLDLPRAEAIVGTCGCAEVPGCGAMIRFNTTDSGEGERRLALYLGGVKWDRPWAELMGSPQVELLAQAEHEGHCLWITSRDEGEAVWFKRATGEAVRRMPLR